MPAGSGPVSAVAGRLSPIRYGGTETKMNETEALVGLAELGVGLAGFAGIVAAFRRGTSWHPADGQRMWVLLTTSLGVSGNALVAAGLSLAAVDSDLPWRCGSALHIAWAIVWLPYFVRRLRHVKEHWSIVLRPFFAVLGSVLCAIALLAQLSNAVGWPHSPSSAVFFLALLAPLGVSASTFADLLLVRPDTE
jgi:RsiW-degrading membrane proteinase PrsW (M82 family)